MKQGMEIAAENIDENNQKKVKLKFIDSKAEAKTAVSAMIQLASVIRSNTLLEI
ncbi:MAG: hypothetical protein IPK08_19805 [Bacteroidetes bacterium]|nr:hypothetical protein [Bacteroidota bacterium]